MAGTTETSSRAKPNPLLWLLLLMIIAGIIALAVLLLRPSSRPNPPSPDTPAPLSDSPQTLPEQPPRTTTTSSYGGSFYYAGMPRTTTRSLNILTNIAYMVGYDEQRRNPAWVCFRLFKVANLKRPPRKDSFRIDPIVLPQGAHFKRGADGQKHREYGGGWAGEWGGVILARGMGEE